jgi:hypothetical protein
MDHSIYKSCGSIRLINVRGERFMKKAVCILWISVGVLLVLSAAGQATKIIYQSPKELATQSSQIVRGTVTGVKSYWNEEGTKIFTEALVAVDETYKGAAIGEARVLQLGGIVGHVNMRVEGALTWRPDEEVLLFLEPNVPGTFSVSGFSQGKFDIARDPNTGKVFVKGVELGGAELVGMPSGAAPPPRGRVPLDQFINETLGRR